MPMANASKVLTVKELCHYLRVHQSTVYRLLKKGMLPGFKVGSDWRFNIEAIDRWRLEQGGRLISEGVNSRLVRG
jgi:excisionase family DNA binding protein